jgi:uncharacterized membrane protein YgcG
MDQQRVDTLNQFLSKIQDSLSIGIAVVTLAFDSKITQDSFSNYTLNLARAWKVGTKDGRGVLIAFSKNQRYWRVQITDDLTKIVSKENLDSLFNDNIKQQLVKDNYFNGINEFTRDCVNLIIEKLKYQQK